MDMVAAMSEGVGIMNSVQNNRKLRRSMGPDDVVVRSLQNELPQRMTCENKVSLSLYRMA